MLLTPVGERHEDDVYDLAVCDCQRVIFLTPVVWFDHATGTVTVDPITVVWTDIGGSGWHWNGRAFVEHAPSQGGASQ